MLTPGLVGKDLFQSDSKSLLAMDVNKEETLKTERLNLRKRAQSIIKSNAARGADLRTDLDTRIQTSDGKWYQYSKVTESNKQGILPELKPIQLDETGKIIDTKAAKQLPVPELSKFIGEDIKWPSFVPEEARSEESYNKWIRTRYGRAKTQVSRVQAVDGILRETGHAQADIGMNPWVGAQVKYGPEGNQTTTQKYIVEQGDTIQDVAAKFGVSPKQIQTHKANKGKVKKGILTAGEKITIQTIRSNTTDSRAPWDLETLDMGGKDKTINQFKAFEEYVFSYAPESEKSKVLTTTTDTHSVREMGTILHSDEYAPTAESARFKMDLQRLQDQQGREIRKVNPLQTPSDVDKFKADIIAKNPTLPNTIGLQPNTSSTRTFHDRVKSKLQSKGFQREAARLAGQSPMPWANVAGDFVGVIYDGMAVAANPTDKQAIVDLFLSGTQAITSGVGAVLIAVPEPTTSGLGYVIMRAGDQVGRLERLWNMQREGVAIITGKVDPNIFKKGSKTRQNLEVQQLVKGKEVAEIKNEFQLDKRIKRQNLPKLNF